MFAPVEAVDGVLQFILCDNYGFKSRSEGVREVVVWGGCVANCGEDELSKTVDREAGTLQRMVYCPGRTKGGVLVRPKYHQGDRAGEQTFPALTDLSIRLCPTIFPRSYGWITPSLRRLRLLCVVPAALRRDAAGNGTVRFPSPEDVRQWISPRLAWDVYAEQAAGGVERCRAHRPRAAAGGEAVGPREAAARERPLWLDVLAQDCPELESVTLALCSNADPSMQEVDWLRLLPPSPVPWSVCRLLLLAVTKSQGCATAHQSREEGEERGGDAVPEPCRPTPERCESPLSTLNVALLRHILSFAGRPHWACVECSVGREDAERLGLPPDFRPVSAFEVLDERRREDSEEEALSSGAE